MFLQTLIQSLLPDPIDHEGDYRLRQAEEDANEREARMKAIRAQVSLILRERRREDANRT